MLIPYYEVVMPNEERSDMYSCSTKKPDHRLNKILDLSSFMKAFGIYKSVMTEVYPQRQKELDLYERNIIDMGTRYSGSGFYEYHKQFSAKAAAYLQQHSIKIDWSIRDNILYNNIFTGQQASSCRLCHSLSSLDTSFCPQSLHDHRMPTSRHENNQQFKSTDTRGRAKQFFQNQEICNNFNGPNGCFRNRCGALISALVVTKLTLKRNAPVREVWLNPYQSQKTNIPPATGQTNNATRSVNAPKYRKIETVS